MLGIYEWFLLFGVIFAVMIFVFDNAFDDVIDSVLESLFNFDSDFSFSVVVSFLTAFGGIGLFLTESTGWSGNIVFMAALILSFLIASGFYFLYLNPMHESENNVAFSEQEYVGKKASVITPIPANGYGEVLLRMGASNVSCMAASYYKKDISAQMRVVVKQVKDGLVYVVIVNDEEVNDG